MELKERITLLVKLGEYINSKDEQLVEVKQKAFHLNGWFTTSFTDLALQNIYTQFLQKNILEKFAENYALPNNFSNKTVGIVMAGNIPLVGFHDFLCGFLCGHQLLIKLSEKDEVLLPHLVNYMATLNEEVGSIVKFAPMLKNCDAYIATGSNNSARYFEQYFGKYPNIIRKNRTSVAILTGEETELELANLADDVHLFFGLGCRNVTKLFVPKEYDFVPLLNAFKKYDYHKEHNKFKNNYDYNLAIHILNKIYYMTNESIILVEDERNFSPISQLNYTFYSNVESVEKELQQNDEIQCIVGTKYIPYGNAQQPNISQYADGVDTMAFLMKL